MGVLGLKIPNRCGFNMWDLKIRGYGHEGREGGIRVFLGAETAPPFGGEGGGNSRYWT